MGSNVVQFARKEVEPLSGGSASNHTKPKDQFLLVPARILPMLARLEQSINAYEADTTNTAHVDWDALYGLMACLELSPRYAQ